MVGFCEVCLPCLQMAAFLLCPQVAGENGREGERENSLVVQWLGLSTFIAGAWV